MALSLANLAALMRAQGRHAQAEEHLRRALSIREDALGPDHPLVKALHGLPLAIRKSRHSSGVCDQHHGVPHSCTVARQQS